jgi:hydroxymethylglutaryl-CoA lyase
MAAPLPGRVRVREVGPRDGFQNEPELVPTGDKVRLTEPLADAGLRRLEPTSFVGAAAVRQTADAEEVPARGHAPGRGRGVRARAERARARAGGGFVEIAGRLAAARRRGDRVRRHHGDGGPGLGPRLLPHGAQALGPGPEPTAHLDTTRGQGLAGVLAAPEAGVDSFQSSVGEICGRPVPRGATGNIALEGLVSMLQELGDRSRASISCACSRPAARRGDAPAPARLAHAARGAGLVRPGGASAERRLR